MRLYVSLKKIFIPVEFLWEKNATLRNFFKKCSRGTDIVESVQGGRIRISTRVSLWFLDAVET